MINTRQIDDREFAQPRRQIATVRRSAVAVANHLQLFAAPRPHHDRAQEIWTAESKDITSPDNDRSRILCPGQSLTLEFRATVDAYRQRLIALRVEPLFQTIKNVVRGNRDQESVDATRGTREIFGPKRIRVPAFFRIAFATIDIRPRRTIDYGIWTLLANDIVNLPRIGDVKRLMIVSKYFVTLDSTMFRKSTADETAGAGD